MSGVFLLLLILRVEMGSLTSLEYSMSHSRFLPVPTQPPRESQPLHLAFVDAGNPNLDPDIYVASTFSTKPSFQSQTFSFKIDP